MDTAAIIKDIIATNNLDIEAGLACRTAGRSSAAGATPSHSLDTIMLAFARSWPVERTAAAATAAAAAASAELVAGHTCFASVVHHTPSAEVAEAAFEGSPTEEAEWGFQLVH